MLTQGTGGVSLFALVFEKAAGATVLATSSSSEKLERLLELGATQVVNYRERADWGRWASEMTGAQGIDHVVEVGGAGTLEQSIKAVRTGGTVSLIGVLSRANPSLNLALVVIQNLRL